jgi:hypothetical protein
MQGFSFNGRMSSRFQNVAVQKRGSGKATPPIPLMKEKNYDKFSKNLPV